MREQEYFIALNMVQGLGTRKTIALLRHFSSPSQIFKAKIDELSVINGIGALLAKRIKAIIDSQEFAKELKEISKSKTQIITFIDNSYPDLLKQIYDPPVVLYLEGDVRCLDMICVALVGCRRASFYGIQQAERLAQGLSVKGICVVSGLARGIDAAAHRGAIISKGKTIAVLGSGLKHIYPKENRNLFQEIAEKGAVISEFPLWTIPFQGNFPQRNRIISGLAKAVVVVEAAQRSGSLITANLALEQGRDVYAVPGPANAINAQGTNRLIKEGAKLVENAEEILEELNIKYCVQKKENYIDEEAKKITRQLNLNTPENKLLEFLSSEPMHIDLLVKLCKLEPACVYRNLLELQLKGLVQEVGGKRFIRKVK